MYSRDESYFVKNYSKSDKKYIEDAIVNMMEFLIDTIFVQFGGRVFHQSIGIPMGTNWEPLLADLFLYSYESDNGLLKQKQLAQSFNFSFRYIDDVLTLNNSRFGDFLHLIYPSQLEINTTYTVKSASYLDLHLEIDTQEED